jgi:hypothetical protein
MLLKVTWLPICIIAVKAPVREVSGSYQCEHAVVEHISLVFGREPKTKIQFSAALHSILVEMYEGSLVAEDDDVLIWVLESQLSNHGYSVASCGIVFVLDNARDTALEEVDQGVCCAQDGC